MANIIDIRHNIVRRHWVINKYQFRTNVIRRAKEDGVKADATLLTGIFSSTLPKKSPRIVAVHAPTMDEFLEWLSDISNYIQAFFSYDGNPLLLEQYQINWLRDSSVFRWCGKSRRIGLSFVIAAEALAYAQLTRISKDFTFLSYTLEEALNKIEYARIMYEAMPSEWKRRKIRDRRQSLEFDDPVHGTKVRLVSHAQRAPRGSGGDIYLDEFAHFQWASKILEAASAYVLTGKGRLSIISTPFGEGDPFYEVGQNDTYSKHVIYWWECPWLSNDIPLAKRIASRMSTEERVEKFGTSKLKQLFKSYIDIDSFKQEMEVEFLSTTYSYFPKDLIMGVMYPWQSQHYVTSDGTVVNYDYNAFDEDTIGDDITDGYKIVKAYSGDKKVRFFKFVALEDLINAYNMGNIGVDLYVGFDIGRRNHPSDIVVLEEVRTEHNTILQIERFRYSPRNMSIPDQKNFVIKLMNGLPTAKLGVDATGLGLGPTEDLQLLFPGRVIALSFSQHLKSEMTKNFKIRMQSLTVALAEDKDLINHIYSIKQTISDANRGEIFFSDETKAHHADMFWSTAMASFIGTPATDSRAIINMDSSMAFSHGRQFAKTIEAANKMRINWDNDFETPSRVIPIEMRRISGMPDLKPPGLSLSKLPRPESILGLPNPDDI